MRVVHVVGARPNFMKAAPVIRALAQRDGVSQKLIHTGQHYDRNMSSVFFDQLGLPEPDANLGVGSASHATQTAHVMIRFEQVVLEYRPDMVLVYGDVNSTMAATLVCAKLHMPVAHVEAGLRSFDRTMPEEINRLVTDHLAECLFTPSADGNENLLREGVGADRIHLVGNVMIDTLVRLLPKAEQSTIAKDFGIADRPYALVTLHRPSNVDEPDRLEAIMRTLVEISLESELSIVFPLHPRTRQRIRHLPLGELPSLFHLTEPLDYLSFLALQRKAAVVITDSGGIQEETTFLGVPCLTVRENTERPVTVVVGTNTLIGTDMDLLRRECRRILAGKGKRGEVPPLWDGKAAGRIAEVVDARG